MQETKDTLVKSNDEIENMTSDSLITTFKYKDNKYSTQISDLDKCRQEMQTLMDMLGGAISMRKKQSCKMIAHNARNTTTKARECIKSMQPLLGRRQLTLNPISSEIFKTSKVVKFGGDAFPHFFTWRTP